MSVIFKTLRKLGDRTLEGKERSEKSKRGRNIYSFRRIFFSPLGILSISLFIFFSGVATIYGLRYLKGYLEQKSKESFLVRRGETQTIKTEIRKERDELAVVPSPPNAIPVDEAKPGRLYLPSAWKKGSPVKEIKTVRYLPPRFLKRPKKKDKKITSIEASQESLIPQEDTSKALTYITTRSTLLPERSGISHTSPSDTLKIEASPEQGAIELPPVAPDITKSNRAKARSIELSSKRFALKEGPVTSEEKSLPERPVKPKEATRTKEECIHLADVERSARIASLITKIQRSISTGSSDQTEDLIDQLALVKGEENSYVLKLRAFWHLCQDDYRLAASFLDKVLSKNENDLEAGINMAILEIKTNHLIEARKRLTKLRKIYPENTMISKLIQKLKL